MPDDFALQSRHAAVLLQRARRGAPARTRAGTEPRLVEPVRREIENLDIGVSPYACACREAHEETGLSLRPEDLHLAGLVSEHGFQGRTHWLMFLFEVKPRLKSLPPHHAEGRFQFFTRAALDGLNLPQTDREQIWPWFWRHRGGFFAAHCHCHPDGRNDWTLEEALGKQSNIQHPTLNIQC